MSKKISGKEMPPAVILCGGKGSRLRDISETLPKPMVPVGQFPIVWHIMKIYAAFGVKRFILCLGYKREAFIDYFLNYRAYASDITVKLGPAGNVTYHNQPHEEDWEITLADTGLETMTGGRIARGIKYLKDSDKYFFMTYGDAVADINISELFEEHVRYGKLLTVSAVHPAGRFGEMEFSGRLVTGFHEKPQTTAGFINGGFMVASREFAVKYLNQPKDFAFEDLPMRGAVDDGEMLAYQHDGFWQCMDTAREYQLLNDNWASGNAPWTRHWDGQS